MKSEKIRITIRKVKDELYTKAFNTRERLSRFPEFYGCLEDLVEFNDNEKAPNNALVLAEKLFEIKGVQSIEVNGYIVSIEISAAFSWQEIEDDVRGAIRTYIQTKILETKMGKK